MQKWSFEHKTYRTKDSEKEAVSEATYGSQSVTLLAQSQKTTYETCHSCQEFKNILAWRKAQYCYCKYQLVETCLERGKCTRTSLERASCAWYTCQSSYGREAQIHRTQIDSCSTKKRIRRSSQTQVRPWKHSNAIERVAGQSYGRESQVHSTEWLAINPNLWFEDQA